MLVSTTRPSSLDDHLLTAISRSTALREQAWIGALVTSMRDERDYVAILRGKLPDDLRGVLIATILACSSAPRGARPTCWTATA